MLEMTCIYQSSAYFFTTLESVVRKNIVLENNHIITVLSQTRLLKLITFYIYIKLTEHLLSINKESFYKAMHHLFFKEVGLLKVEPQNLKSWLIQDRYCTGGYTKIMGIMISRLALYEYQREPIDNISYYSENKAQNILKVLSFDLSNMHSETIFFNDILSRQPYFNCKRSKLQKP